MRIGTRRSKLAKLQTSFLCQALIKHNVCAAESIEVVEITTSGDLSQKADEPFFANPGVFVKEIEQALLDGKIDIAVHSLKDLPSTLNKDFSLPVFFERHFANDVICCRDYQTLNAARDYFKDQEKRLPMTFATSSPRRKALAYHHFVGCQVMPVRGNVDSRLKKLVETNSRNARFIFGASWIGSTTVKT